MTLIVAMITPHYALLASDRRITTIRRKFHLAQIARAADHVEILAQEDSDTKVALLNGRYAMGFAGLGRIRHESRLDRDGKPLRERMESWLMHALTDTEPLDYFDEIATQFGETMSEQQYYGEHAFLATGYSEAGEPQLVRIDNRTPQKHTLHPYTTSLDKNAFLLDYAGMRPNVDLDAQLRAFIGRTLETYPLRPDAIAGRIRSLYRKVAQESGGTVGDACSITTLPLSAVPVNNSITDTELPTPEAFESTVVSLHYPTSRTHRPASYYIPAYISPAYMAMGGRAELGRTDYLDDLPLGYRFD